jgi:O-antigen/teichoic acid export membrane protein
MSVPFSLLLASGLTWVPLAMNAVGAIVLAPLTFWLVKTHGISGAATAWLAFNAANYLIVPAIMFRSVLKGEYRAWLLKDTLPFIICGLICVGAARSIAGNAPIINKLLLITGAVMAYAVLICALNAPLRAALLAGPGSLRRGAATVASGPQIAP